MLLDKSTECSSCGTSSWQWEEDAHAFTAVVHVCPGCATKDRLRAGEKELSDMPGSSIKLVTRDTAARLMSAVRRRPLSLREKEGKS